MKTHWKCDSMLRWFGAAALAAVLGAPAMAQNVAVTAADPAAAEQGTLQIPIKITGRGFRAGAQARFSVTGTTNPGGVTVLSTTYVSNTELHAMVDIADDALIDLYDIEVQNVDGRGGKGMELFSVTEKDSPGIAAGQCVNQGLSVQVGWWGPGTQIGALGSTTYEATLRNCPTESGDLQLLTDSTRNPGHPLRRDFSHRLPVSERDDPLPGFLPGTPHQDGIGGMFVRWIGLGYSSQTGYAPGYPVASCWADGRNPNVNGCEFTTVALVNFRGTDSVNYSLYIHNIHAEAAGKPSQTEMKMNEKYENAMILVKFTPGSGGRLEDAWEVEPLPVNGQSVGALSAILKGKTNRYGYFNMHFRLRAIRVD